MPRVIWTGLGCRPTYTRVHDSSLQEWLWLCIYGLVCSSSKPQPVWCGHGFKPEGRGHTSRKQGVVISCIIRGGFGYGNGFGIFVFVIRDGIGLTWLEPCSLFLCCTAYMFLSRSTILLLFFLLFKCFFNTINKHEVNSSIRCLFQGTIFCFWYKVCCEFLSQSVGANPIALPWVPAVIGLDLTNEKKKKKTNFFCKKTNKQITINNFKNNC